MGLIEQIHLSYGENNQIDNSMIISYATKTPEDSIIYYGENTSLDSKVIGNSIHFKQLLNDSITKNISFKCPTCFSFNCDACVNEYLHHVVIGNLDSGMKYYYQISNDNKIRSFYSQI
jgi:hypothetical protein